MRSLILIAALLCACSTNGVTAIAPAGVIANLTVPSDVTTAQIVQIHLSLKNSSDNPISLHLGNVRELSFDPRVIASDGTVVWTRLGGTTSAGEATTLGVAPGDTATFDATWDLRTKPGGTPVPPGVYTVEARVLGDDMPVVSGVTAKIRISGAGKL